MEEHSFETVEIKKNMEEQLRSIPNVFQESFQNLRNVGSGALPPGGGECFEGDKHALSCKYINKGFVAKGQSFLKHTLYYRQADSRQKHAHKHKPKVQLMQIVQNTSLLIKKKKA